MRSYLHSRACQVLLYWVLSLVVFRAALARLVTLSLNDDRYSHIILIPFICLGFVWLERARIFKEVQYCFWAVLPMTFGLALGWAAQAGSANLGPDRALLVEGSALVLTWIAGFVLLLGTGCAARAVFPLGLLLLAIPLPPGMVEEAEVLLQKGSAEVTDVLFRVVSTPVHRKGLVFSLPGVNIEVAKECSGIRAAIALFIAALLLGHVFLRSAWSRACCVLLVVPIAIFKNAVRITMISWLRHCA